MSVLYQRFARDWEHCLDFSDDALLELYNYESYGGTRPRKDNGYFHGKRWLNVTVAMWNEDISRGLLQRYELYGDENEFPRWWLDLVLK